MTDKIRLGTWNVHKCIGMDGKFSPERVERIAARLDCDVLALQEVDKRWKCRSGLMSGEIHGMKRIILPQTNGPMGHGWNGNCLYTSPHAEILSVESAVLPSLEPRGAILCSLLLRGRRMFIIAAHFSLFLAARRRQVDWMIQVLREQETRHDILCIMGDTNEWRRDTNPSSSLRPFLFNGLTGQETGSNIPTFPATKPLVGLDRILSNHPIQTYHVFDKDTAVASDHLPLCADMV